MTPEELNETLLYLLRSTRDQWQTLSDLASRVLATIHYLELRDSAFENQVTKFESEARTVLSQPTIPSLQWLDDTIRKLEGLRKRRQN